VGASQAPSSLLEHTLPLVPLSPSGQALMLLLQLLFYGSPWQPEYFPKPVYFLFSRGATSQGKKDRCHSAECTWAYRCTQIPTVTRHIVPFQILLDKPTKRQPNVKN